MRVTRLHPLSLMNCFLSGLKEEIQRELYMMKPQNLHDAVGLTKLVEDKLHAMRVAATRPLFQQQLLAAPPLARALSPPVPRANPLPIKRLTPSEMAACREKGLCFNCDAKFSPGHRYKPALFLCLMIDSKELPVPEDEPHRCWSYLRRSRSLLLAGDRIHHASH
ncbi:hypothetical protein IHE45_11G012700 [Dioscorea alata]|uniref:Uncharacterized protein n=1 Tax=Dioscorea alata TaxID=55571 RepID=A0ACB7V4U7_DIOAL|nr:hypothetical protein IHE45_11G012700 [Dioscorea alata]